MLERRIKELAIALEALSRITGEHMLFERVRDLLGETIEKLEDEHNNVEPIPPPAQLNNNDDIPF